MKKLYLKIILLWARVMSRYILTEKMMVRILIRYCYYYARNGKKVQDSIIWGNSQVANIKYWSAALRKAGYKSYTIVPYHGSVINKKSDYDFYYDDLKPGRMKTSWFWRVLFCWQTEYYEVKKFWALLHIMKYAKIYHVYFEGGPLSSTKYWKEEAQLLKLAGVKIIGTAYGSDFYMYSRLRDLSVRHALYMSYPQYGIGEKAVTERVEYWNENFDFIPGGFITDGRSRWDLLLTNPICIDTEMWSLKSLYSRNDGINTEVKIIHLSNHRAFTGTDFIIKAIDELKSEGYKIDFYHPKERIPNDRFRQLLNDVDIVLVGLIFPGYGLAAIEAMATGNCAVVNLESAELLNVFRRYSWLNECPLLSADPETIKERLKLLILNPELREELGRAGRQYVEKYHSEKNMQFWFGKVYDKLVNGKEVDFASLYFPSNPNSYNNSMPLVQHPLIENKLPATYNLNKQRI